MRIAVISTMADSPWGGSEELWAAMANEALNESCDVAVSVYYWPSTPHKILELQQKGVQIFQRSHPKFQKQHKGISKIISKCIFVYKRVTSSHLDSTSPFKELFSFQPEIICINQGGTYDSAHSPTLLTSLYELSIPYVVVCQFNNDAYVPNRTVQEAAIKFFTHASRVVFVSHHNMRVAERQLAKTIPNAVVLQNPVNLSNLTVVPWLDSEILYMASVARLEAAYKGQDVLLEALSSPMWQSRNWRLLLYGVGPDQEYLEALAEHYGISDRVEFRGHVKDVRAIWSENHLLVISSRSEGTPLALVEAMLCGRPAVVTDVGGNTEWVEEQYTGFIAEAPTAKSLSTALERAWLAQADWRTMGIQAHENAAVKFNNSPGKKLLEVVLDAAKPHKLSYSLSY